MKLNKILFFGFIALMFASCKPKENLNYLQDVESIATSEAIKISNVTLQSGDKLIITVSARDLDVVKPFNQNYSSGQLVQNTQLPGNVPTNVTTDAGPTYYVNEDGNIDFPVLGKINTKNKSLEEFKEDLTASLKRYIKDPTVSVKLGNFKVSVLGEVNRPGEYLMFDGKGTLLSAISMAGDLSIYGKRNDILIVRTIDGSMEKSRIDITNSQFLNSPYFNLKQGDVIYVSSNETKQKSSRLDPNAGIYISVASIVVTILALVFKK